MLHGGAQQFAALKQQRPPRQLPLPAVRFGSEDEDLDEEETGLATSNSTGLALRPEKIGLSLDEFEGTGLSLPDLGSIVFSLDDTPDLNEIQSLTTALLSYTLSIVIKQFVEHNPAFHVSKKLIKKGQETIGVQHKVRHAKKGSFSWLKKAESPIVIDRRYYEKSKSIKEDSDKNYNPRFWVDETKLENGLDKLLDLYYVPGEDPDTFNMLRARATNFVKVAIEDGQIDADEQKQFLLLVAEALGITQKDIRELLQDNENKQELMEVYKNNQLEKLKDRMELVKNTENALVQIGKGVADTVKVPFVALTTTSVAVAGKFQEVAPLWVNNIVGDGPEDNSIGATLKSAGLIAAKVGIILLTALTLGFGARYLWNKGDKLSAPEETSTPLKEGLPVQQIIEVGDEKINIEKVPQEEGNYYSRVYKAQKGQGSWRINKELGILNRSDKYSGTVVAGRYYVLTTDGTVKELTPKQFKQFKQWKKAD